MSNYKADKPKVYELAREMDMKAPELIKLLNKAGFDYKGNSSTIHEPVEEIKTKIKEALHQEAHEQLEKEKESGVNLVGVYYDAEKREYMAAEIKIPIDIFNNLGGSFHKKRKTIYKTIPDFDLLTKKNGVLNPKKS